MKTGMIFDIQKFSIHDGPGIRTTVFLKGCSLKCFWCHNPESIQPNPQLLVFPDACIGCGACVKACTNGAHQWDHGSKTFQREACMGCGLCVKSCYTQALVWSGTVMTVDQVMEEIRQDLLFYQTSDGGVTFSGGEPLLQADYLQELLRACKELGIHTAVETAGHVPWENYEKVLPYTDLFLHDLKCMNDQIHKQVTGAGNSLCIANISKLAASGARIRIRVPVIPGINDNKEAMYAIRDYIESLNQPVSIELLPFHRMGAVKYQALDLPYQAEDAKAPTQETMEQLNEVFWHR